MQLDNNSRLGNELQIRSVARDGDKVVQKLHRLRKHLEHSLTTNESGPIATLDHQFDSRRHKLHRAVDRSSSNSARVRLLDNSRLRRLHRVVDQFRVSRSSDSRDHLLLGNRLPRLHRMDVRRRHSRNRSQNKLGHHRNKVVVESLQVVHQRTRVAVVVKKRSRNDLS